MMHSLLPDSDLGMLTPSLHQVSGGRDVEWSCVTLQWPVVPSRDQERWRHLSRPAAGTRSAPLVTVDSVDSVDSIAVTLGNVDTGSGPD